MPTVPVYPYGQTVTVVTRTRSGVDSDGNDVYTPTSVVYANVPVWPGGEGSGVTGSEQLQGRNSATWGVSFLLPDTAVTDRIDAAVIGGVTYEVSGKPGRFRNPRTGMDFWEIRATRVEG